MTQKDSMTSSKSRFIRLRYVKLHIDDLYGNGQNIHEDPIQSSSFSDRKKKIHFREIYIKYSVK